MNQAIDNNMTTFAESEEYKAYYEVMNLDEYYKLIEHPSTARINDWILTHHKITSGDVIACTYLHEYPIDSGYYEIELVIYTDMNEVLKEVCITRSNYAGEDLHPWKGKKYYEQLHKQEGVLI
tara:strand:- start:791 stop:1159 length:369 start_codon:yes stop_codon:yes gene_type:complete